MNDCTETDVQGQGLQLVVCKNPTHMYIYIYMSYIYIYTYICNMYVYLSPLPSSHCTSTKDPALAPAESEPWPWMRQLHPGVDFEMDLRTDQQIEWIKSSPSLTSAPTCSSADKVQKVWTLRKSTS